MAYKNKDIDHQKRKDQEGSYSLYNYLYHYLMDNYEPGYSFTDSDVRVLMRYGKAYCNKGGKYIDDRELKEEAEKAIDNFNANHDERSGESDNFGSANSSMLDTIKKSVIDLRW